MKPDELKIIEALEKRIRQFECRIKLLEKAVDRKKYYEEGNRLIEQLRKIKTEVLNKEF